MDVSLAMCGLSCETCPGFLATKNNDDKARTEVARTWSKEYGHEFKPEEINCFGCMSASGPRLMYCDICEIRTCGVDRGLENCGHCMDYPCERLNHFFGMVPAAKDRLDQIHLNKN